LKWIVHFNGAALPFLTNQVVVLTGANGGLGSALVKKLLGMDAEVVVGKENSSSPNCQKLIIRLDLEASEIKRK